MRHLSSGIVAFVVFTALAGVDVAEAADGSRCGQFPEKLYSPGDLSWVGAYSNPHYMYAVTIPAGLTAYNVSAPAPQHGFGVVIAWEPRRYLWVNSESNSVDWEDERTVFADYIEWARAESSTITGTSQTAVRLGRQHARQLKIRYRCSDAVQRIQVNVVSLARGGLLDEAGLLTTADHFAKDYRMLMAIVRSWRITGKY